MPYDTLSSGMSLELRKKKGNILWGDRDGMGASIYSKRKKKESKQEKKQFKKMGGEIEEFQYIKEIEGVAKIRKIE